MAKKYWDKVNKKYKKTSPKFHFSIIIILVMATFILCFALYMISSNNEIKKDKTDKSSSSVSLNTSESISETTTETTVTTTPPPVLNVNPVPENTPKDFSYFNDCAFIGDSLTVGLSSYGILPEKNVLANVGMNIDRINDSKVKTQTGEISIFDALKQNNPKNVYIMLGSNGIAWLSNEHMISKYSDFVDRIKKVLPDSRIYILSIPPVSSAKETSTEGPIQNSAIDSYNSELLKFANEKNYHFVDINTALKGNDGKLPLDKASKDGMHFKKETYDIMLNYILNHTVKE